MNFAHLKNGTKVIVDSSQQQTRTVEGETFFLSPAHVNVFYDGGWQAVRKDSLKSADYGNPFGGLRR